MVDNSGIEPEDSGSYPENKTFASLNQRKIRRFFRPFSKGRPSTLDRAEKHIPCRVCFFIALKTNPGVVLGLSLFSPATGLVERDAGTGLL